MSTEAISLVSERLAKVLNKAMSDHPTVVPDDPTAADEGTVSLWLYQVAIDEFVRNAPPPPAETADGRKVRYRLPPLGVTLFYLLTPMVKDQLSRQSHLAQAMLAFHENACIRVPGPTSSEVDKAAEAEVNEVVRISLMPDTLDDRVRLWDSLDKPYRLSVCYQVRTVRLVSTQVEATGIVERGDGQPTAGGPVMAGTKFLYIDGFSRTARLVLDVRDWYASAVRFDVLRTVDLSAVGGEKDEVVRAVVRPTQPLTVTADRAAGEPWPFAGKVDLVTRVTPAGVLAFFGRVRTPAGGPLRQLPLVGVVCALTVSGAGYRDESIPRVPIPASNQPPETIRVELTPGPDLPPGPTEVAGGVFAADGKPRAKASVTVKAGGATLAATATDDAGLWRAELKTVTGPNPVTVDIDVKADGPTVTLGPVQIRPGRVNRVPQTVLRGTVRRGTPQRPEKLRPVSGARVTVAPFAGETQTRFDGSYVFYPPPTAPLTGTRETTVVVDAPGAEATTFLVSLGEGNTVPAIILPEQA